MALAIAACSSNPVDTPPPTISPARAAVSPHVVEPPAGVVHPLTGPGLASVFDSATRSLVILGRDGQGRTVVSILAGSSPTPPVALPANATAIAGDDRGKAFLATRGGYFRLDVATGSVDKVDVTDERDTDFTAITRRADGLLVLGSADGSVYTMSSDTGVGTRLHIFARVDALAAQDNTVVVLDRGQTSVTEVDSSGSRAEQALRAGDGATTIAADHRGRVLVANTRGDELLVFGTDPLILRQRYPVPDAPYGLAGSSRLAWVSQTAANSVVGYDLSTGIPVEKVRYRTVQQPDILAFDDATDTLYVVSGSGAGVQVIRGASR
jgi:DNA-binding beta-propeller fold protein YncE